MKELLKIQVERVSFGIAGWGPKELELEITMSITQGEEESPQERSRVNCLTSKEELALVTFLGLIIISIRYVDFFLMIVRDLLDVGRKVNLMGLSKVTKVSTRHLLTVMISGDG
ncbi:hypothetical protein ACLOJK_032057 [Asimina triloba]